MKTQTVYNGKHLKYLDKGQEVIKEIKRYFEEIKDYTGFPTLPKKINDMYECYEKASETEQRMLFTMVYTKLIEALRHWRVDKDALYGKGNKTFHGI